MNSEITLLCNALSEREGIWVILEEGDKLTDSISHWIPIVVKLPTIM